MRLLVTGGAGFLGANFVLQTCREHPDADVVVLDALTYAGRRASLAAVRGDVELVVGDVADASLVDRLVARVDAVVHFAAESHNDRGLADPAPFVQTNLVGTFRLLEAVRRHDVRLHHVSTDEVFGDLALDSPERFRESSPYAPHNPYSATKAGSDLLVRAWAHSYGVRATVSNGANSYGPLQHVEKLVPRQITHLVDGLRPRVYGTGANVRDWLHAEDHSRAIWAVLERGMPGRAYVVGAGQERSNRQVVARLLELFGRSADDYDEVPDRPGHDRRYATDSTLLRTELGWQPRYATFEDGLAATVDWYREHEAWWRPLKADTERYYAALGR